MSNAAAVAQPRSTWREMLAIVALRDVPFWTKSWLRRIVRFLLLMVYLIVFLTLLLKPFENRLAFPGWSFASGWVEPQPGFEVRDVWVESADGHTIHAWFCAPRGWRPEQGAVLFSHGNGYNLSGWQTTMKLYRDKLHRAVLIYDYPGFGKSTGTPNEASCYASIDAAYDWLVNDQKVPAKEVILIGSSMGGGCATDLATRAECRMLVLVNSFTSFPDMAQKRFPFLPARWVVSNQMNNLAKIDCVSAPVLIAHGTEDNVVPFAHGEQLARRANEPKRFFPMQDHPHMDPVRPDYFSAILDFLEETRTK